MTATRRGPVPTMSAAARALSRPPATPVTLRTSGRFRPDVEGLRAVAIGRFYARRVLRLLPAAALVSLVTLVGAWLWLTPIRLREFAHDAIACAFYVIDPVPWLCDATCPAVPGNLLAYRDSHHLTTVLAELLARPLAARLPVPG